MTCLFSLQKNVVLYEAFIIVGCSSVSRQQSYTEKKHLGDNYMLSLFNSTSMKQKWIFMLFVTCSFCLYTFCLIFCLVTLLNTVLNEFTLFRKFESHKILIATHVSHVSHHQVLHNCILFSKMLPRNKSSLMLLKTKYDYCHCYISWKVQQRYS